MLGIQYENSKTGLFIGMSEHFQFALAGDICFVKLFNLEFTSIKGGGWCLSRV